MECGRSAVCALVTTMLLLSTVGYLSVFHFDKIKEHVCFCHCDKEMVATEFTPLCRMLEPHPEITLVKDQSQIKGKVLQSSQKVHEILQLITEAKKEIMRLKYEDAGADVSASINNILNLVESIDPDLANKMRTEMDDTVPAKATEKLVCQEEYCPENGFRTANCTDAKPINQVISVLVNAMFTPTQDNLERILTGIQYHYPGMMVHVAIKESVNINKTLYPTVNFITGEDRAASNWNNMLSKATTPYVLVARDLVNFDREANLERAIRIASTFDYDVVGGSVRDSQGNWNIGCQHHTYRNYTLKYKNGFFKSHNSCVVCEHMFSPFVAKVALIKEVNLAANVAEGMLFEDFFIRVKRQKKRAINCPDVMFHTAPKALNRDDWLSLVKERKLNRIYLADGRAYRYSCGDAGISCTLTKSIATAPCCMEHLQYGIRDLFQECEKRGLDIELNCGQLIGAVKLGGVLPWEKDGDVLYLTDDHQKMRQMRDKMVSMGYNWGESSPSPHCCWLGTKKQTDGYFAFRTGIWRIEVYGRGGLPSQQLRALGLTYSKTLIDGEWLQSPSNPALFSRNRYAHEIFKHQEHYFDVPGLGGGFAEYRPTKLNTCTQRDHQACLDQYHVDGNIQFKDELL